MMKTITQKLEATLSTSNNGDIIVAIPAGLSQSQADQTICKTITNAVMPVATSGHCFVYGCKSKFSQPLYKASFLEKCKALGDAVSFACI